MLFHTICNRHLLLKLLRLCVSLCRANDLDSRDPLCTASLVMPHVPWTCNASVTDVSLCC